MYKLETIHLRILKVIFRTNSTRILNFMSNYRILSIYNIYNLKLLCLAYKVIHNQNEFCLPHFLRDIYQNKNQLSLRNKNDFITVYYRTKIGQRNLKFCLAKQWNKLPSNIKNLENYKVFKKECKNFLLSQD